MWCFCLSWLHNSQHHLSFNLIWLKLRRKNTLKLPAGHSYSAIFPNRLIKETSKVQYETNSAQHLEKRDTFLALPGMLALQFILDLHWCYSKQNLAPSPRWPDTFTATYRYAHIFYVYVKHIP